MTTHSIQGNLLYVTVISCSKLKDTEWISRQDPYVCVVYGGNKFQTRTCIDGSKNPNFGDRFVYTLTEGLKELNVEVMNSNSILKDYFIGSAKIQLVNAISRGFDDSSWPLTTREGRHAGEIRLSIEYPTVNNMANNHTLGTPAQPSLYSPQPPSPAAGFSYIPITGVYPPPSSYASYYQPSLYPPIAAIFAEPYPLNPAYNPQPYGPHNNHPLGPHPPPFWAPHAK